MKSQEITHLLVAIVVLAAVLSLSRVVQGDFAYAIIGLFFAAIIIIVNVAAKKLMASFLDAGVEHEIWHFSRYGFKPHQYFKKSLPFGVIVPLFLTAISVGSVKFMSLLTYETSALKRRAARRFGYYSFTEMTDYHNSVIGAAGIVAVLALSFVSYWISFDILTNLWRYAAFYAFWNMLPISKLDGSQIFFGSRVVWTAIALITAVFTAYAVILGI